MLSVMAGYHFVTCSYGVCYLDTYALYMCGRSSCRDLCVFCYARYLHLIYFFHFDEQCHWGLFAFCPWRQYSHAQADTDRSKYYSIIVIVVVMVVMVIMIHDLLVIILRLVDGEATLPVFVGGLSPSFLFGFKQLPGQQCSVIMVLSIAPEHAKMANF